MELEEKNVLVLGAGKSGIGAINLLIQEGAFPILFDGNEKLQPDEMKNGCIAPEKVRAFSGQLPDETLESLYLAVLSPGIPTDAKEVTVLRKAGIPVIGEIELAFRQMKGKVLGVTGTNGKTTTVSILGKIMAAYETEAYTVGNIGSSFAGRVFGTGENAVFTAELSSFQLETCEDFHPAVSAILNITEDHLNRHHTMEEYIRCKEKITLNQTKEDVCVLNYEDPVLREFGESACPADVFWFSSKRVMENAIYLDGSRIILTRGGLREELLNTDELQIIGTHNYENVMAASAMAYTAGVPLKVIREVCRAFPPVAHRIEFSGKINGAAWYNDSKGTNPDAAIKGIQAMNCPTLLIAGGYDKGSDYREWIRSFEGRVKWFVLEGKTRFDIKNAALECGFPEERIVLLENMTEAMEFCLLHAEPGDAVLLSPACASWGEFKNFEVRGDEFKAYVREHMADSGSALPDRT
ncbi:MAG: UDP-N-acetylmuramoyl-L-alanine--D-glutamate ligase [Lachnospiraceae bacterium]|nr:UDP-N-acetylmuramoyl-L-alanine--D-glutamate ligase [Lachnospiraceae bacterium]